MFLRDGHLYDLANVFAGEESTSECVSVAQFIHTASRATLVPAGVKPNVAAQVE